jgi:glycosyltransferase involved in cell wall biosynthesis
MPDLPERPPIAQAPLSAVLLAFNVGAEFDEVVAAWDGYLSGLSRPYEILVVDDGSTDDTAQRAEQAASRLPSLRVLKQDQHLGVGMSLRAGIAAARHPLVFTAPCNKEYSPPDLYRVLEAIDQVDLVAGYRVGPAVPAWLRVRDFCRRFLARVFLGAVLESRESWPGLAGWRRRWLARWLFGVRVQDPECPYRLYRRHILERLPIQCASSVAQIEILAKANHLECIMAEVPVSWVQPASAAVDPVEKTAADEWRRLFFDPDFGHAPNGVPSHPGPIDPGQSGGTDHAVDSPDRGQGSSR